MSDLAGFPATTPSSDGEPPTEAPTGPAAEPAAEPSAPTEPAQVSEFGALPAVNDGDVSGIVLDPQRGLYELIPDSGSVGRSLELQAPDGHSYLAAYDADRDEVRFAVCVICTKLPYAQRDVARALMPDAAAARERGYMSLWVPLDPDQPDAGQLGAADAPDDDPLHGVGVEAWYRLWATAAEIEAMRAASNAIHVTVETRHTIAGRG